MAQVGLETETARSHVAKLEAIVDVLLEQIAAGNVQDVADDIRAELKKPPTV